MKFFLFSIFFGNFEYTFLCSNYDFYYQRWNSNKLFIQKDWAIFLTYFLTIFPLFLGLFLVVFAKVKLKKLKIVETNQLVNNSIKIEKMHLAEISNLEYSKKPLFSNIKRNLPNSSKFTK